MVGEVVAAGLTPADLEKEILKLYSSQLVTKEVTVTVTSSSFPVFVTGAVIRPGKILSDHPITALEAIMEAGGFDYAKADLGHVRVVREREGRDEELHAEPEAGATGQTEHAVLLEAFRHRVRAGKILLVLASG